MIFKRYSHNPPHLFVDGTYYFITAGSYEKRILFYDDDRKQILLKAIQVWLEKYKWTLEAWIIFGNHYHIMTCSKRGEDLPQIIQRIHGRSATLLNKLDYQLGRQVWWNYWDTCIRGEKDYFTRLNYLFWNAVKHAMVPEPEAYRWSSFHQYVETFDTANLNKYHAEIELIKDIFDDF